MCITKTQRLHQDTKMSYFQQFPLINYELNGQQYPMKDIFRQAGFITEYKPLSDLYESYTIIDGETPHMISERFYGSAEYFWVILVFNNIQNLYFDWPLTSHALELFCQEKYGEHWLEVKHYENDGFVVGEYKDFHENWTPPIMPSQSGLLYPVTFYEYESKVNDEKRRIEILRPELLSEFVTQFKKAING